MTSPLFFDTDAVSAELESRRRRLTHDWQAAPRRARRTRRLQLALHLPVRIRRHA